MKNKIKEKHKVLIITVVAVVFIWVVNALYGAFISHEGPFLSLLVKVTRHESFLLIVSMLSFLVFGTILARLSAKHDKVKEVFKKYVSAIETSMDGIAIYNREGKYVYLNRAYASINGYANPDEVIGKTYKHMYDQKELERMEQVCAPELQKNGRWRGELIAKRKNGSAYFQEASVTMLEDGSRVLIIRDITWRKRSEERLRRSERFLNTIFNSIRDPFCIVDSEFRVIRVNDAYAQLKNKQPEDLIGRKCHEALHNSNAVCEDCVVNKTFHSADPCVKEKLVTLQNGAERWMEIYTYPIVDEEGKVSHVVEYTRDITDRKKTEGEMRHLIDELEYLSRTDGLTGLMNRRALTDSLVYELDRARRYKSELSLILCDIDNFKEINDTYGHDAGDRALRAISATLNSILRKPDMAGRHGGDEFMLILPETSITGAEHLADKFLLAVRDIDLRFMDGKPIPLSISIGIACLEADSDSMDSFIKRADDAMYVSKQGGRDRASTVKS